MSSSIAARLRVVGVVAAVVLVAIGTSACAPAKVPDTTGTPGIASETGRPVDLAELEIGDCFDRPDSAPAGQALQFSTCDTPHMFELFAEFELPDGDFPESGDFDGVAKRSCRDAFEGYVGGPYSSSIFDFTYIGPSRETWTELGDRTLGCVLLTIDDTATIGSARGSGR